MPVLLGPMTSSPSSTFSDMLRCTMKATPSQPEIISRNGKAVSVIVPIEEYKELLERAEDASDLKWLKRARAGKLQYRPLEEYLSERKTKARA
jgi:PHD/YefM family antitoxin component YafN of YafNO toxin-antitoxin module